MLWAKSQAGPIHSLWALSVWDFSYFIFSSWPIIIEDSITSMSTMEVCIHQPWGIIHHNVFLRGKEKEGYVSGSSLKLLFFLWRLGQILAFWTLPWFPSSSMSYSQGVLMQMTENSEYRSRAGWHCCAGSFSEKAKQAERQQNWNLVPLHWIWRIWERTLGKIHVDKELTKSVGTASSGALRNF